MVRRIALFTLGLLACLYGCLWLVGQLRPTSSLRTAFPSWQTLPLVSMWRTDTLRQVELPPEQLLAHLDSIELEQPAQDTVIDTAIVIPPLPEGVPYFPLEVSQGGEESLERFFRALRRASAGKGAVRILHFGDSQMEGDRVTSFLRSRLQGDFGGGGFGLVGPQPSFPPGGLLMSTEPKVRQRSLFPRLKAEKGARYGLLGVELAVPKLPDGDSSRYKYGINLLIDRTGKKSRGAGFRKLRLFASADSGSAVVRLYRKDSLVMWREAYFTGGLDTITIGVPESIKVLRLEFLSQGASRLYGVSMERIGGVQVDNVALRGSSGMEFQRLDSVFFPQMLRMLSPQLVVLQFGVNVVPGKLESYQYYRAGLARTIRLLRSYLPEVAVLVVGVSDMAERQGGEFRSYSNLAKVTAAQRGAALAEGGVFWDCRQAMGGENSIVAWQNAKPPLANPDYVHFSNRGARFVGEMLYAALMQAYRDHNDALIKRQSDPTPPPPKVTTDTIAARAQEAPER